MSERTRLRVLLVADNPTAPRVLHQALADSGWTVETAPNAATAVALSERTSFALTIINLRLAGMSGSQLAAIIAQRWPDTAVMIIAGPDDVTKAASYLRAGADDHLQEPFDVEEVIVRAHRALERHRLLLECREHKQQLQDRIREGTRIAAHLMFGAMKSLSSALEAKDPCTRDHSKRVSWLAREIARTVGVGPQNLERIGLAGELHDIGKIGVRESILLKPGPLTTEEFLHVQTHPVIGERILAPVLMDIEVAAMVRHHHEHYAGGGYPDGLRGSAIPLGARVLAVADAFEALTSDRPYRLRFSPQAALDILHAGAGAQWQPALVEILAQHCNTLWAAIDRNRGRDTAPPAEPPTHQGQ